MQLLHLDVFLSTLFPGSVLSVPPSSRIVLAAAAGEAGVLSAWSNQSPNLNTYQSAGSLWSWQMSQTVNTIIHSVPR